MVAAAAAAAAGAVEVMDEGRGMRRWLFGVVVVFLLDSAEPIYKKNVIYT